MMCYIGQVKKKQFGFSLDQDMHAALKARAEEEGTSMAAVCREALLLHLQKPALEVPLPPRPSTTGAMWESLKENVRSYLNGFRDEVMQELDDFLSEPEFHPSHTPDILYRADRPRRKYPSYAPQREHWREGPGHISPPRSCNDGNYSDTRWLDELWA